MRSTKTIVGCVLAGVLASGIIAVTPAVAGDEPVYPLDTYPPSTRDNVVLQWNEEALECIRVSKPGPTVVARSLFLLHTATYDAWSGYDSKAVPTLRSGWVRRPSAQRTTSRASIAVSHGAHHMLSNVFPDSRCTAGFDARLTALGYTIGAVNSDAVEGRRAAAAVISSRVNDGANQNGTDPRGSVGVRYSDTTGYAPVNTATSVTDPWRWQPLTVTVGTTTTIQRALTPQWGTVRPFVPGLLDEVAQVPDPNEMSQTEREQLVDEVVSYSAELDDRTKAVAEYWADGPSSELPPGHWNLFAQWTSRRHNQSLAADAKMFFGLNGALHDAAIAAWSLKYRYDFARPISAVRELRRGQLIQAWAGPGRGTQWILGENWQPYQASTFPTPPFPAYTSGHSTFSAAAAAFLKDFGAVQGRDGSRFGASVTIEAGSSTFEAGVPARDVVLTWATFEDAADEAGISRQYGGIHWSIDDVPSRDLGKKCGEAAFSLAKKYWEG